MPRLEFGSSGLSKERGDDTSMYQRLPHGSVERKCVPLKRAGKRAYHMGILGKWKSAAVYMYCVCMGGRAEAQTTPDVTIAFECSGMSVTRSCFQCKKHHRQAAPRNASEYILRPACYRLCFIVLYIFLVFFNYLLQCSPSMMRHGSRATAGHPARRKWRLS